jgi:hypothetical protein
VTIVPPVKLNHAPEKPYDNVNEERHKSVSKLTEDPTIPDPQRVDLIGRVY